MKSLEWGGLVFYFDRCFGGLSHFHGAGFVLKVFKSSLPSELCQTHEEKHDNKTPNKTNRTKQTKRKKKQNKTKQSKTKQTKPNQTNNNNNMVIPNASTTHLLSLLFGYKQFLLAGGCSRARRAWRGETADFHLFFFCDCGWVLLVVAVRFASRVQPYEQYNSIMHIWWRWYSHVTLVYNDIWIPFWKGFHSFQSSSNVVFRGLSLFFRFVPAAKSQLMPLVGGSRLDQDLRWHWQGPKINEDGKSQRVKGHGFKIQGNQGKPCETQGKLRETQVKLKGNARETRNLLVVYDLESFCFEFLGKPPCWAVYLRGNLIGCEAGDRGEFWPIEEQQNQRFLLHFQVCVLHDLQNASNM